MIKTTGSSAQLVFSSIFWSLFDVSSFQGFKWGWRSVSSDYMWCRQCFSGLSEPAFQQKKLLTLIREKMRALTGCQTADSCIWSYATFGEQKTMFVETWSRFCNAVLMRSLDLLSNQPLVQWSKSSRKWDTRISLTGKNFCVEQVRLPHSASARGLEVGGGRCTNRTWPVCAKSLAECVKQISTNRASP